MAEHTPTPLQVITPRTPCRPPAGATGVLLQHPFVGIDLETTGFSADINYIVEIGAVKMRTDGTVIDKFSVVTNPGKNVPLLASAEAVHHLTPGEIRAGQPLDAALRDLQEFVGTCGVVAHNLTFENRFLSAAYSRILSNSPSWQGVCTLAAARRHLNTPSHKLGYLLDLLEVDATNNHRAVTDAEAAGKLLARMIEIRRISGLEPLVASDEPRPDEVEAIEILSATLGATQIDEATGLTSPAETVVEARPPAATARAGSKPNIFGSMTPTGEQSAIVGAFGTGEDLKVSALAGTGKTSTLLALSRLDDTRDGIYVAFNRSVADEAKRKFGKQVSVSTAHALAYRYIRTTDYGPLLGKLGAPKVPWHQVGRAIRSRVLAVDTPLGRRQFSEYRMSRLALETIEQYCRTVDATIEKWHVPTIEGIAHGSAERAETEDAVLQIARRAWKCVLDPDDRIVAFTPDHFLKLWATTHPKIGRAGGYLLFDEAQDANPLVRDIVSRQDHLQRVWVGDEFQSIYGFTGAVNSLAQLHGVRELSLTQSWRFGDAIADTANVYLTKLGATKRVRGNPHRNSRLIGSADAVDAVLCRTNGDALAEVITAQAAGKKTALIGDADQARRFCVSARALQNREAPKSPELEAFASWGEVQDYVENAPGVGDWKTLVSLIDDHTVDVVQGAVGALVDPARADTQVVTCHKAKGLEFDRVRINHNWTIDTEEDATDEADMRAERMLAYVSLTRAMMELDPGTLIPTPPALQARSAAPVPALASGQLF